MALLFLMQAIMVVIDKDVSLTVTGNGDVLEPPDGIIGECGTFPSLPYIQDLSFVLSSAIGSGGAFALGG